MGALLKNPLFAIGAAALIAWWFLRRRKDCACPPAGTTAPTPGGPPIATNPWAAVPPPATTSPGTIVAPPPITPPIPPPRDSDVCVASGGSWGWDPTRGAGFCAHADAPPPARTPISVAPATAPTCASIGGVTLSDGSCCAPSLGCNPTPPAITPPATTAPTPTPATAPPAPVWGGYTGDPYAGSRTGGGAPPAYDPEYADNCRSSNGVWGWNTAEGYHCICGPGKHLTMSGKCADNIV